ncbi:MAG TPA: DUF3859 domain-containing protein [Burkholderiales bacterium]|jgi:hypothetical protein|nr:DUF3859 domain-containing protein [Burkholderiales bacterium]
MKRLLAFSLFVLCCSIAQAQAPAGPEVPAKPKPKGTPTQEVGVEILWYGVVNGDEDTPQGEIPEKNDHVPARQGAEFGVAYAVYGVPEGTKVKLRQVARYPAPGRRPAGGKLQKTEEADQECEAGETCFTSYAIETKDELLPGEWRLELYYRGRKVMEQRFVMRYEGV